MLYLDGIGTDNGFIYYIDKGNKGYGFPETDFKGLFFTQSREILENYKNKGAQTLSSYLGIKEEMGLYELFSFFFEGKIRDDFEMIEALFTGFLEPSDWCFCLKLGVSFCWFTVKENELKKLGTMQFSEVSSKYTVGRFMKRLRYNIVKSGINLDKVRYLVWNMDDLGYDFGNYILKYDCLDTFFSSIDGLRGMSVTAIMKLLRQRADLEIKETAESLVDCLNESFGVLKLRQEEGVLYCCNVFYKDYNTVFCPIINKRACEYGIIIDCEGVTGSDGAVDNGVRELGGVIYCKYGDILINLDMFSCDSLLLGDTLEQVLKRYKSLSGLNTRKVSVITYGASDQKMLESSIDMLDERQKKLFRKTFSFRDVYSLVENYILTNNVDVEGRLTLANIARALNVKPIFPKHKPLNDSKTLFNILAKILADTNTFINN